MSVCNFSHSALWQAGHKVSIYIVSQSQLFPQSCLNWLEAYQLAEVALRGKLGLRHVPALRPACRNARYVVFNVKFNHL